MNDTNGRSAPRALRCGEAAHAGAMENVKIAIARAQTDR
jgi:hypothetical protein